MYDYPFDWLITYTIRKGVDNGEYRYEAIY